MNLPELITLLEAAQGPSRGLDDLVWAAEHGKDARWFDRAKRPEIRALNCACDSPSAHESDGSHWYRFENGDGGPKYTKSVDEALMLIEHAWGKGVWAVPQRARERFTVVRVGDGYQPLSALRQRTAAQVRRAVFRHYCIDVTARRSHGSATERGHNS